MKDLKYYLNLPYTVVLRPDEQGDYVARIEELPGCSAHGPTPQEALKNLEEAQALWIGDCLEAGDVVPEPVLEESLPSGKWVQRVPRTLHRKLVLMARRERVSLNQLVTSILSEASGARRAKEPAPLAMKNDRRARTPRGRPGNAVRMGRTTNARKRRLRVLNLVP